MKHFIPLMTLVLMLSVAHSCEKPEPAPDPFLSATPTELSFNEKGGSSTVSISSNIDPSINCQQSWIKVSKGSYSGSSVQLTVNVEPNEGTVERSGQISVNGDKKTVTIAVKQGIKTIPLTVSKSDISLTYAPGKTVIEVTSTSKPTVTGGEDWCKYSLGDISSERKSELAILAGANLGSASRSTTFTVTCGNESVTVKVSQKPLGTISTASTTAVTQTMLFNALGMGWNLGNQMDAINNNVSGETLWGNGKCTQATFDNLKKAGFASVRIPITWMGHIGAAPAYVVEDAWMDRVAEIVGYAEKAGLVAIINTHHDENHGDTHWLDIKTAASNSAKNKEIKDQIFALWTQIAQKFQDKGEWLIFEPFNEINDGGWGWSSEFVNNPGAQYKVLNEWNQTFVDAVRATGGKNATRWLATVGYCQNLDFTIAGMQIPKDYTSANRLIVGVHDYDPYDYTLNADTYAKYSEWGHTAAKDKSCSSGEKELVASFDKMKSNYSDKGYPIYIGEMGCSMRSEARAFSFQKYYMEYFCKACADRKISPILWDNGAEGSGNEQHGYIKHDTGAYIGNSKQLIDVMVKAVTDKSASYTLESVYNSAPK